MRRKAGVSVGYVFPFLKRCWLAARYPSVPSSAFMFSPGPAEHKTILKARYVGGTGYDTFAIDLCGKGCKIEDQQQNKTVPALCCSRLDPHKPQGTMPEIPVGLRDVTSIIGLLERDDRINAGRVNGAGRGNVSKGKGTVESGVEFIPYSPPSTNAEPCASHVPDSGIVLSWQ